MRKTPKKSISTHWAKRSFHVELSILEMRVEKLNQGKKKFQTEPQGEKKFQSVQFSKKSVFEKDWEEMFLRAPNCLFPRKKSLIIC